MAELFFQVLIPGAIIALLALSFLWVGYKSKIGEGESQGRVKTLNQIFWRQKPVTVTAVV